MAKTLATMTYDELAARRQMLLESVAALEETVEEAKQEGWRKQSQEDALVMLGEARRQLALVGWRMIDVSAGRDELAAEWAAAPALSNTIGRS
jgi:hypothetical protein